MDNQNKSHAEKEEIKKAALEKLKKRAVVVNIEDIAEAEARKAGDAHMTEAKGKAGFFKRLWKHTFFDGYYRQKQINKVKEEIKRTGSIYSGRLDDVNKVAHESAMQAIAERFAQEYEDSEYEDKLLSKGESKKKLLDIKTPEARKATTDIKNIIIEYAKGNINTKEAFESEKKRILDTLNKQDILKGVNGYADDLFEKAQHARLAIEHGAKMEELDFDTNIIIGKAKSSLKTEANFNKVDKLIDKMKKTKIGRFMSPAVLSSAIGLGYSISALFGARFLRSKAAAWFSFGGSVAVASAFSGMNESQRIKAKRAQHGLEMAEGGEVGPDSKKREQMNKFQYEMKKSTDLSKSLRDLMFVKDKNGKDVINKNIDPQKLGQIYATIADIEARRSLNSAQKIDLISYSSIGNVEKESTELIILVEKAKRELRERTKNDLAGSLPQGESFDKHLEDQIAIIRNSLLGGESGITALDKNFKKFKNKEVAKKVWGTIWKGLTIGAVAQEIAAAVDGPGGRVGLFEGRNTSGHVQTPLSWVRGLFGEDAHHLSMGDAHEQLLSADANAGILGDSQFKMLNGGNIIPNSDGTFNVVDADNTVVADHITLHTDANGALDAASIQELGAHGIIANVGTDVIEGQGTTIVSADDYINSHLDQTTHVARDGWYDNDTPKPIFDKNELKLWWGGVNNTGIDASGNYVYNVFHMTSGGSFHDGLSVDAQEKIKSGGLKMLLSLTKGTQNHVFEVTIDINGNAIIPPDSEIGKLFFSTDSRGHAVFEGQYAEAAETFGVGADGREHVKMLATDVGHGRDAITSTSGPETIYSNNLEFMPRPIDTEPPFFLPFIARRPLEPIKNKESVLVYEDFLYGEPYNDFYDDESYLDRDSIYDDAVYTESSSEFYDEDIKNGERLTEEEIERNISKMEKYLRGVDMKMMKELDEQIGEPMGNKTRMSVVLPCYREAGNIYKTLSDWTIGQKDLKPEELEIIAFVNAPSKNEPLDAQTISEINRFKNEHPEYQIRLVKHNFDFPSKRKMGAIYKMPADLALYRNMKRIEAGASEEIVSAHLMRSGGADALGRNPRFLRELIDFMENHPETEQIRTQSAYPPEVREKFPLFNLITVFNHSLNALYTRGNSNIGLGTYRARAYAEASGFDPLRETREEIDLGMRIRAKVENKKGAMTKLVKKNAIDNPRRELFALAKGDTVLHAYKNFSAPQRDKELREFDWNKELPNDFKQNVEFNLKNMNREFDAYFQHFLKKSGQESGIVSRVLKGAINEKNLKSGRFDPETRLILQDPEALEVIKVITEKNRAGEIVTRSSPEVQKLAEFITRKLFDRTLRLAFGLKPGANEDYNYERTTDNNLHIIFKKGSVEKLKVSSSEKWENFTGYWAEKNIVNNQRTVINDPDVIRRNNQLTKDFINRLNTDSRLMNAYKKGYEKYLAVKDYEFLRNDNPEKININKAYEKYKQISNNKDKDIDTFLNESVIIMEVEFAKQMEGILKSEGK